MSQNNKTPQRHMARKVVNPIPVDTNNKESGGIPKNLLSSMPGANNDHARSID